MWVLTIIPFPFKTMNKLSYAYRDTVAQNVHSVKLSYPVPRFHFTKLVTSDECILFPMETTEYSEFSYPSSTVNLLENYDPTYYAQHRRIGSDKIPFKLANLFHLPDQKERFYIGRSLSASVCLITSLF